MSGTDESFNNLTVQGSLSITPTPPPTVSSKLSIFSPLTDQAEGMIHLRVTDPMSTGANRLLSVAKRNSFNTARLNWIVETTSGDTPGLSVSNAVNNDDGTSSNSLNLLHIAWDGKVGIGSIPTRAKLEISGMVDNTVALFGQDIQGISLVANSPSIGFNAYYNNGWKSISAGWTGNLYVNQDNGGFSFQIGQRSSEANAPVTFVDRLTITKDGKVGIGTTNPATKLEIVKNWDEEDGGLRLSGDKPTIRFTGGSIAGNQSWIMHLGSNGPGNLEFYNRQRIGWSNVISLTPSGNVTITGKLGVAGQPAAPRTQGWGGGIHTWDLEAEGTIWSRGGYQSGNRDVAENYLSDMELEPGDIVSLDPNEDKIIRSATANDSSVIGVISTAPGMLLNSDPDRPQEKAFPVALCGRVPCKVTDEEGSIRRGDLLTTSSTPGYAMKAKPLGINGQDMFRPGTIIGKALEPLESGKGVIEIFVLLS